jgi:Cof subfamily protein (haloacid dehalogenase superfamily)
VAEELTVDALRRRTAMLEGGIRLVAVDVDGTLLTSDHVVTARTVEAVQLASSCGVEVMLATSRGPCALQPVLRHAQPLSAAVFVASQGAVTGQYTDDGRLTVLERHPARLSDARQLVRHAAALGLVVHWFAAERWYVSGLDPTVEEESRTVGGVTPEVADLLSLEEPPDKLMVIAPTHDPSALRALAGRLPTSLMAQASNPRFLEITRRGVDKGAALARLCRRKGLEPMTVAAIGDGPNDLAMLAYAGVSIAPANADSAVLERATFVTRSNDDNGVAYALEVLVRAHARRVG